MKSAHRSFSIGGRFGFARTLSLERQGRCLSIPYWHIDLMARDVFRLVWMNRKEAVLLTYQMPEDCAAKDSETCTTALSSKEAQLEKLQKSLERLRRMCAMGDITRKEFLSDSAAMQNEIRVLELQIKDPHFHLISPSSAKRWTAGSIFPVRQYLTH